VAYVGKKLNYARTEYRFHEDRLEFEEGFFNINKKVIKYKNVSEVTLHKGLLQRIYGLGTIYLATLATGSGPWNNIPPSDLETYPQAGLVSATCGNLKKFSTR
jgi:membrane protein YdbS with pleckstrin-like domain